jgi:ribose/xylose/arabinose/galactoside ABC-type transport system permease subunit
MEKINKLSVKALVAVGTVLAGIAMAVPAFATDPPDPVNGAFTDAQTSLTGYIVVGIGVIVAVLLAGLGVGLLVKYLRKAVRAA